MSELQWRFAPSLVEAALNGYLPVAPEGTAEGLARLRAAMRHGVFSGGKRLRPQLVLEAAGLVGGPDFDPRRALRAASAIELIHAYSLIHDDLPAMDDAVTRRGRPTCHIAFDEATAVLAGDALQTLAFELLATSDLGPDENLAAGATVTDAAGDLRVLHLIAVAAGETGMAGGQSIDIAWTRVAHDTPISGAELAQMHALKTGALIRAAAQCGAVLGRGSDAEVAHLRAYGENLGRAFQIWDDVLDVEGDPAVTGKASSDAANAKMTFPAVYGLGRAKAMAAEACEAAIEALASFDEAAANLRRLARYVVLRNN